MTDRNTMSTDEMIAAVDRVEHERGIYSDAEAYDLLLGLRDEVKRLREVIAIIENDVRVASGELMVEMPRPGSPMARVMVANALMRRERDRAKTALSDMESARDDEVAMRDAAEAALARVEALMPKVSGGVRSMLRGALKGES